MGNLFFRATVCRALESCATSAGLGVLLLGLALPATSEELDPARLPPPTNVEVDFNRDIRPILESSCYRCHTGERPRSRYNLATRETALRGGSLGVAIIPGDSAQSPLVHYVARVIEGMEMPPPGRDAPLTGDQVSLLRAWIDQGAMYPEAGAEPAAAKTEAKVSLGFQYFSVSGNEAKFREHGWMPDGAAGGILEFNTREPAGEEGVVTMNGRLLPGQEDYAITLGYEQKDLGWVRGGYSQYRRWFDGTGGYYAPFGTAPYQIDGDRLYLDTSRAWIEFGLDRPRLPQITLGYEYLLREGERSTLQWGLVRDTSSLPPVTRAIYPASKRVEEQTHVIRLDVRYDLAGFLIEDNFRGEFADLRSDRTNVDSSTLGAAQPDFVTRYQDGFRYFEGANTLRIERQVKDWLFLSGGYLYSNLDGEASFNSESFVPSDPSVGPFAGASADEIVLRREANVMNVNAQVGPWEDITLAAGAQADWIRQEGFGNATIAGFPSPLDANLNRQAISEHLTLRFSGLPYTVLHAEARLQQEHVDQFEQQTLNDGFGNASDFLRDTEARSDLWEARAGFTVSPWTVLSFDGSYRRASRDSSYDHTRDFDASSLPGNGYPAFILGRDVVSDDFQARLVWRTTRWLKTTFKYQHANTRIDTRTDDAENPLTGILIPGGRIRSGNYEANIYSVGAALSPWRRLVLNATFSFSDAETATGLDSASVTPYDGRVYSVISSATFALDGKTDLTAAYSFSKSDYDPKQAVDSLPLGLEYDRHGLVAGIRRQFKHGLSTSLQYAFYRYDEPTSGGALDYTAHGILVGFTKTLR